MKHILIYKLLNMLLVKWDVNDADYIYKVIEWISIDDEKFIKTLLEKFIVNNKFRDKWYDKENESKNICWYSSSRDEEIFIKKNINKIISIEDFNKLVNIFNITSDEITNEDLKDEDFLKEVLCEIFPRNQEDWRYVHHVVEVKLYKEVV